MNLLYRVSKFFDWINTLVVVIGAILVVVLTFIVGADITLRYLFHKPLGWVKELSEYTLVALGFLTAAWILKDDGHVTMDLMLVKLSPKAQTMMNIITSIISTVVVLIVTWFSFKVTLEFYQTGVVVATVLEPPKWILMTPVIVGSLLLAIQCIRRTFVFVDRWKKLSRHEKREP